MQKRLPIQHNTWQVEMEARFEFEETLDQDLAIKAVKEDI